MFKKAISITVITSLLYISISFCGPQVIQHTLAIPGERTFGTLNDFEENPLAVFSDQASRLFLNAAFFETYTRLEISKHTIQGLLNILSKQRNKKQEKALKSIWAYISTTEFADIFQRYDSKQSLKRKLEIIRKFVKGPFVADIGCGTGGLSEAIVQNITGVRRIIATDLIDRFNISNNLVEFRLQPQEDKLSIDNNTIDTAVLSYVLHHIEKEDQITLLKDINRILKIGGILIVLEDTFSNKLKPINNSVLLTNYLKLDEIKRKSVLSFCDWLNNTVFGKLNIPVPFTFKNIEEWERIFEQVGFSLVDKQFLGIDKCNLNFTPRGIMVFEKSIYPVHKRTARRTIARTSLISI